MLDDGPGRVGRRWRRPLAAVAPLLAGADYRIANLECPVATTGSPLDGKIYSFRAHPARAVGAARGRFDAVSLANNHSGDYGPGGVCRTMACWMAPASALRGQAHLVEAHVPMDRAQGLRIAVPAINEFKPWVFRGRLPTTWHRLGEDSHVIADIRRAPARPGADPGFPSCTGAGAGPSLGRQRALARRMIDAGAAAVVGGHPRYPGARAVPGPADRL